MKKQCAICGKEFNTKVSNKLICDEDHYINCYICGKKFKMSKNMQYEYIKGINIHPVCSKKCLSIKTKQSILNKYGVNNYNNRGKAKDTCIKKYGVSNVSQVPSVKEKKKQKSIEKYGTDCVLKNKQIQDKAKDTKVKKYNDENFNNRNKAKDTCLSKYGVDNIHKLKSTVLKSKNTCLSKYGDPNYNNMDKNIQTCIQRYGVPYSLQSTHTISLKKQTCLKKYGKLFASQKHINEIEILKLLDTYNIKYINHTRSIISPYELDIYIPDKNVAIECNGTYWHSDNNLHNRDYHYNKSKLCEEKGIRLIHVFEYEWNNTRQRPILEDIIKNAVGVNSNKIYARKLKIEVRPSKDMRQFFNDNNIQGFRGGSFAICLVDKYTDKVYMSYMMGKAFFGKGKYQWEVIRGATLLGYNVIGGASKIWKYFIKTYNPQSIVYYIDYNYFNGNSLPYLGLKYIKTQPSYKNYFIKEHIIKNRDPLHHKQIVQGYKDGTILQIWNAGTKVYVWYK